MPWLIAAGGHKQPQKRESGKGKRLKWVCDAQGMLFSNLACVGDGLVTWAWSCLNGKGSLQQKALQVSEEQS